MKTVWVAAGLTLALGFAHAQAPAPQEPAEAKPAETQPAPAPAVETTPVPAPAPQPKKLGEKQVPLLSIRWDCGQCTKNDKVPPLLETAYATAAAAAGYTVSGDEKAEMVITEFNQRPPGARAVFGAFAGRDVVTTRVEFRGKSFSAADYMANAWVGMNGLCDNVGKEALTKMLQQLQGEVILKRIVLLAALCAPLPSFGNDAIFVQVPAMLDPSAPIDPAVKRECGIEPLIGNNVLAQIQVRYPGAGIAAGPEQAGAGRFVQLTVVSVQGVGGGNWSGAKAITVRALLFQQGKEVAMRVLRRGSRGGVWGGMSGTCPIMERIAVALGKDVSLWLNGVLIGKPVPETKSEDD